MLWPSFNTNICFVSCVSYPVSCLLCFWIHFLSFVWHIVLHLCHHRRFIPQLISNKVITKDQPVVKDPNLAELCLNYKVTKYYVCKIMHVLWTLAAFLVHPILEVLYKPMPLSHIHSYTVGRGAMWFFFFRFLIQSTTQYFISHPFTQTQTLMEQPSGPIWGLVFCLSTHRNAAGARDRTTLTLLKELSSVPSCFIWCLASLINKQKIDTVITLTGAIKLICCFHSKHFDLL